jgi:hypothetical protein
MVKRELCVFMDIGLICTFIRFVEHESEHNFVYLEYCPLDCFPAKKMRYPRPIPRDSIFARNPTSQAVGVADRLIYIYTGEEGSMIRDIIDNDLKKSNKDLTNKLRSAELRVASLQQEVENARSGVNKNIAELKNLAKTTAQRTPYTPYGGSGFGSGSPLSNIGQEDGMDDFGDF